MLTLQDLIDAGVIFPGRNNISVQYKGTTYTASLSKEGMILFQGMQLHEATSLISHQVSQAWDIPAVLINAGIQASCPLSWEFMAPRIAQCINKPRGIFFWL